MHCDYPDWLRQAVPSDSTFQTKLSELRRVEREYGDLDTLYDEDELVSLIDDLTYSVSDAREGRANPSKLRIEGDIRNNLASYKSAVMKYARFRQDVESEAARPAATATVGARDADDIGDARAFSLEKDLQAALRANLNQLEDGLTIIDGGAEKSVPSGFIDILARDKNGYVVVIELKAVKARRDVIGQTLAYMGDIALEADNVRGIIVAPDFDEKVISGARVVDKLTLHRYQFTFTFNPIG
ncbi:endonuclease NucS domain-containing protein [Pseudoprimorskyibacter insulae]|uniref:Endonuclease NucS n=1 Tax=Pseudoprimorskyibacter insulae TaxID=1695997 RepID=A0A2R8AX49_9RHOB|nr:endonuclease NucS domain-containing protein [Pseudoprimorskyibacter insulae]SPF80434.1 Endonuclease NucS [Pseudoprimorskyibacter insulae]